MDLPAAPRASDDASQAISGMYFATASPPSAKHGWTHLAGVRYQPCPLTGPRFWCSLKCDVQRACDWLSGPQTANEDVYAVYVTTCHRSSTLFRFSKRAGGWYLYFVLPSSDETPSKFVCHRLFRTAMNAYNPDFLLNLGEMGEDAVSAGLIESVEDLVAM